VDYFWNVLSGGVVTLEMALMSLVVAVVLGGLGAWAKLAGPPWLAALAQGYTSVIRGVPDLVLLLLLFYGGPVLINAGLQSLGAEEHLDIEPFVAGVLTLGLIFGGYLTETFRGAVLSIPAGQLEAAAAYGLGRWRTGWRIVLPQVLRLALPAFTNNWLVLVKSTALVSVLGLQDIMFRARLAAQATRQPFSFYLLTAAVYLAITIVSMLLLRWLDRRMSWHLERPAR